MKWILASSHQQQHVYELWNKEEKLFVFSYHSGHGTLRILSGERRVFQVRKEGLLKNRTALLNEYGIKMARLIEETDWQSGFIEIDQQKFRYHVHNRLYKELFLYAGESKTPLLSCDLPGSQHDFRIFLLMLCWFNLQPENKKLLETV